jgi:hypothetical protein
MANKAKTMLATASMAFVASLAGCSQVTEVSTTELAQVVERDGLAFSLQSIPEEVLDRLATSRVVIVGETHFLREHRQLVVELLRELHVRGFRQLLFEWTQAADWLLADFVEERGLEPDWQPPLSIGGDLLTAIRDFNRTLLDNERIQVHGIDVTLQDYGGAQSFLASLGRLTAHLATPGPLSAFLQGEYDTAGRQQQKLETLRSELEARRPELMASWGEYWYETVAEMVEVELASALIRAAREDHYDLSARLREDAMKQTADRRLEGYPHRTLINVGGSHAQKKRLKGTEQEWLGDYLVHKSEAVGGSAIVLVVTAARIVPATGALEPDYQLMASPENEIFRTMSEIWPDQTVFLPVDDPLFAADGVPMNFEGTIYVGAPKQHYDVFLLLPLAHRVPLP